MSAGRIAVLSFANMSDDPDQDYFNDGITGHTIAELSRFFELFLAPAGQGSRLPLACHRPLR